MENPVRNIAEFQIIGRIGSVTPQDKITFLSVASDYPRKKEDSEEWDNNTHWNRVTLFHEKQRAYVADKMAAGDLVHVRGRIRQNSFERDGATVYTVDLIAEAIGLLAKSPEKDD